MPPNAGDAAGELADDAAIPLTVWPGCGASAPAGSTGGSTGVPGGGGCEKLLLPPPVPLQFT